MNKKLNQKNGLKFFYGNKLEQKKNFNEKASIDHFINYINKFVSNGQALRW
jgi:hypothetical protein